MILVNIIAMTGHSQVVINEVMHKPGPTTSTNQGFSRKEYVEIYNKGCSAVDISCWVLGSANMGLSTVSNPTYIGAFQFPSGTIINPAQHLVIGGILSQDGTAYSAADIDFVIANYVGSNTCDPNTNWLLPNGDGWVALYNNTGTPTDAVYWSFSSTAPNLNTDDDFASNPCVPGACSGITSLKSARQIAISNPSAITYAGTATSNNKTFSRVPDGGTWQRDIVQSITGTQCNNGACSSAASFAITSSVVQPTCGSPNGSITITPTTTGTYTYTWTPNVSTTNSAINLAANSYLIHIDKGGCTKDTTITLINGSFPTAIASTVTNPDCGLNNGQVALGAVTGGAAPYQYNFNGLGYALATSTPYTNLSTGSYSLLVQDANGCIYTAPNIILTSGTGPTAIAVTTTNTSCGASTGQVNLGTVTGGTLPYQYNFNSLGLSGTDIYTNLSAGSYSLIVQDANGCIYTAPTIVLTSGSGPTAIAVTTTNTGCGAPTGQVNFGAVTGGTLPYQYNFNSLGLSGTNIYTNLSAGSYSLIVQDANGCIYTAPNIVLTSGSGPSAIAVTTINESCALANGQVTLGSVTGGTLPYQYNFNGLGLSGTAIYTNLSAGSYSLIIQDASGCTYTSPSIVLTNATGPTAISTTFSNETCNLSNGQITLGLVTGGTPSFQYNLNGLGFSSTTSYTNLIAGTYALVVKDQNGCTFNAPSIVLSNTVGPTSVAAITTNSTCNLSNGSIQIGLVTGGVLPYQYNFNSLGYSTVTSFLNLAASSYTLSVQDGNGCVYVSTPIIISNTGGPNDLVITTTGAACDNTNGQISINNTTGGIIPYTYSIDGVTFSNAVTYPNLLPGNYTVSVKDGNGCVYSESSIISSSSSPIANFNYSPAVIKNEDEDVSLIDESAGTIVSYEWIVPDGTPSTSTAQNFNTKFLNFDEGFYPMTLIVKNEFGCYDSITKYIERRIDPIIYIPNTFTPDGDAHNNRWQYSLTGLDLISFYMTVYNRWGEIVWETTDQKAAWDGFYKGKMVQAGTYSWVLNAKDNLEDKRLQLVGSLNVIY